jgi:Angiotensin-converting enzyme
MEDVWKEILPLYELIHAYVRRKLREFYGPDRINRNAPLPGLFSRPCFLIIFLKSYLNRFVHCLNPLSFPFQFSAHSRQHVRSKLEYLGHNNSLSRSIELGRDTGNACSRLHAFGDVPTRRGILHINEHVRDAARVLGTINTRRADRSPGVVPAFCLGFL